MRTILVPVDHSDNASAVFAVAAHMATKFGATVDAVASRPSLTEVIAPDPIVTVAIPPHDWDEGEHPKRARQAFDAAVARNPTASAAFRWIGGPAIDDSAMGLKARTYDLTIVPRPGQRGARMALFESVLFESGRLVLSAPPKPGPTFGTVVAVHWNRSTETARATALAMPLLKAAQRVILLSVEGNTVPGPSAREALAGFEAHGVAVTEKTIKGTSGPGEALLSEARSLGADVMVKGAYTQSRLRQMFFGGATSHILAHAEIPVIFAH
jgi:nucleotide-binding universal stress UspA family protein